MPDPESKHDSSPREDTSELRACTPLSEGLALHRSSLPESNLRVAAAAEMFQVMQEELHQYAIRFGYNWPELLSLFEQSISKDLQEQLAELALLRDVMTEHYKDSGEPIHRFLRLIKNSGAERSRELAWLVRESGALPHTLPVEAAGHSSSVIEAFGIIASRISCASTDALEHVDKYLNQIFDSVVQKQHELGDDGLRTLAITIQEQRKIVVESCIERGLDLTSLFIAITSVQLTSEPALDSLDNEALRKVLQTLCGGQESNFEVLCSELESAMSNHRQRWAQAIVGEEHISVTMAQLLLTSLRRGGQTSFGLEADNNRQIFNGLRQFAEYPFLVSYIPIPLQAFADSRFIQLLPELDACFRMTTVVALEEFPGVQIFSISPDTVFATFSRALESGVSVDSLQMKFKKFLENLEQIDTTEPSQAAKLVAATARSFESFRATLLHGALVSSMELLVRSNDTEEQRRLVVELGDEIRCDVPPVTGVQQGSRFMDEVLRIFRRSYEISRGFQALTVEARSIVSNEPWLLLSAAKALSPRVQYLDADSSIQAPGKGIVVHGFPLERVFAEGKSIIDPYQEIREALIWASRELDDLASTQFVFSRGLIAVIPPENERYCLDSRHHSYVVFNDHAFNQEKTGAVLVETKFLRRVLGEFQDHFQFPSGAIHLSATSAANFLSLAKFEQVSCVELTHLACLGGLHKGLASDTAPYFEWEKGLSGTRDIAGHLHTAHYRSGILENHRLSREEIQMAMRDKRNRDLDLHQTIYAIATSEQNLLDLARIAFSQFRKGWAGDDFGLGESPTPEAASADEMNSTNARDTRMLEHCFQVSFFLHAQGANKDRFPLLMVLPTLDWWSNPESDILLDTFDMTLSIRGQKVKLPAEEDGRSGWSAEVWRRYVVPYFRTDTEPRFVLRTDYPGAI